MIAGSALATPANAQSDDVSVAGKQSEPVREKNADGDDIVVSGKYTIDSKIDTATGLGLTVQETPQSVSVITSQRIIDQNLISVADVIQNAVGVTVSEVDDVRNNFYARGFDITNYQIDGVPLAWTLAGGKGETNIDVSIYDRVEIVRGATGLLTGVGDPSASVNLVRKHADRTELGGYLTASYGSWDTWRASGDIGGRVTADGSLRFRLVGRYEEGDSYIDLYHNKKWLVYGTIDADVTDTTLLRLGVSHQRGTPTAPAWGALPTFFSDGSATDWSRSKSTSADWTYWNTTNQNLYATLRQQIGDRWKLTLNYNRMRNAEQAKLLYLSGTVDVDTGVIGSTYPYKDEGESIQNSFDGQLKGSVNLFGRDHDVVIGALRSVQKLYTNSFSALYVPDNPDFVADGGSTVPDPGFSPTPYLAVDQKIVQTGIYGAVRANLSDRLKVIGGGRIASWKQKGLSYGVESDYGDKGVFIPYAGVLYDIVPGIRAYASFTRIFTPQSEIDANLRQLPPIEGDSYEIGLKNSFFNDALQTSIALFRIKQNNLAQVDNDAPQITPPGGLPQQPYVASDGATSKGFEIEATGSPLPGWNLNFGYSQFSIEDADGANVNTDQPRKLLKLFTTYAIDKLTLGGGVNYRSKAYSEGVNPVTGGAFRFQQDGYALVNLMARYRLTDNVEIQGNIENLFDKKYYSQIGFYSQYRYGAPRNFTLSASYRFQ
ncbi:TonB-dependent siderophore receptor [Stakelama sp. CBK3Z-3]|uniref:TonB-dependent siderophore receptor n=1 Tax=Stakelama flava TaxID=2860338 RepID=A0ABS6XP20_9SPHN|nr:TonB-dependent siderophore receptor [Stakelama flava]MBW4331962.1 TonB-dependent siderophore receptor [Stakelama flava]